MVFSIPKFSSVLTQGSVFKYSNGIPIMYPIILPLYRATNGRDPERLKYFSIVFSLSTALEP